MFNKTYLHVIRSYLRFCIVFYYVLVYFGGFLEFWDNPEIMYVVFKKMAAQRNFNFHVMCCHHFPLRTEEETTPDALFILTVLTR